MAEILLKVDGLCKNFASIHALKNMQLCGVAAKVHGVVGENGAGKSTLMKILSGVFRPSKGSIEFLGKAVQFAHPREAQQAGISTIFQEFSLLPNLSITENLFLGKTPNSAIDKKLFSAKEMEARTKAVLEKIGLNLNPKIRVGTLGVGEQQMIEIAKGILADAQVFIFDEPTAALASHEVDTLHKLIKELAGANKTIFYISHRLSEIFDLCDDITIMKDGQYVGCHDVNNITSDQLIEAMVGRPMEELFEARNSSPGKLLMRAEKLVSENAPKPCNLTIHQGEIVGIAGLEGQGQQGLMRKLAGFDRLQSGKLWLDNDLISNLTAGQIMKAGIGFVPESRKDDGLFTALDIRANMETAVSAARPFWFFAKNLNKKINAVMENLAIKAASDRANVLELSGGNQQKVVLGRWLLAGAKVLLCEEPTRGVDVGAKREIYKQLRNFTNGGGGVLITSRELPEIIGLCDRILVIRDGELVDEVPGEKATEDDLLRAALPQSIDANSKNNKENEAA